MRKRTAIIHIGTPKTGTTSIQAILAENRDTLHAYGFSYPKTPGSKAHTAIGAFMSYAAGKPVGLLQRRTGPIEKFKSALYEEINGLSSSVHTVIFSSEHAFNQGFEAGVVHALRNLLDPMFGHYRIVAYVRRQDEQAVSLYSTLLRAGRMPRSPLPEVGDNRMVYDFDAGLRPWIDTFGRSTVTARLFQRSDLAGGDVVTDFLKLCGMPELSKASGTENTSLLANAQEFLRLLNGLPSAAPKPTPKPPSGKPSANSRLGPRPPAYLRDFLSSAFAGKGTLPSRRDAEAFYASFAEANERLRAAFFPERRTLFDEDFSRYPEQLHTPDAADILAVALSVTRMQTAMIARLQSERALEKARTKLSAGSRDGMLNDCVNALELDPTSKPALDALLAFVESPDEVFRARQFITGARIPRARKDSALKDLDARFGADRLVSRVAEERKAERRAQRRAKRKEARGMAVGEMDSPPPNQRSTGRTTSSKVRPPLLAHGNTRRKADTRGLASGGAS